MCDFYRFNFRFSFHRIGSCLVLQSEWRLRIKLARIHMFVVQDCVEIVCSVRFVLYRCKCRTESGTMQPHAISSTVDIIRLKCSYSPRMKTRKYDSRSFSLDRCTKISAWNRWWLIWNRWNHWKSSNPLTPPSVWNKLFRKLKLVFMFTINMRPSMSNE